MRDTHLAPHYLLCFIGLVLAKKHPEWDLGVRELDARANSTSLQCGGLFEGFSAFCIDQPTTKELGAPYVLPYLYSAINRSTIDENTQYGNGSNIVCLSKPITVDGLIGTDITGGNFPISSGG